MCRRGGTARPDAFGADATPSVLVVVGRLRPSARADGGDDAQHGEGNLRDRAPPGRLREHPLPLTAQRDGSQPPLPADLAPDRARWRIQPVPRHEPMNRRGGP
jgi:hypothetical protein